MLSGQKSTVGPGPARARKDPPEELASKLFAEATSHYVKAGETLFQAGEDVDGCYWLDEGAMKMTLASPKGEERILAIVSKGSVIGDLGMIDGLTRSVSAIALTDCDLRFVSQDGFQDFALRHPEIYRYFVMALAKRLRATENDVAALAFLSAKGRVARALLSLAESLGTKTGPENRTSTHQSATASLPGRCIPRKHE